MLNFTFSSKHNVLTLACVRYSMQRPVVALKYEGPIITCSIGTRLKLNKAAFSLIFNLNIFQTWASSLEECRLQRHKSLREAAARSIHAAKAGFV